MVILRGKTGACLLLVGLGGASFAAFGQGQRAEAQPGTGKQAGNANLPPANQRRRVFLPVDPRDEAAILAEDAQVVREVRPSGPIAELSLFGSQPVVGRSFVIVMDRSASMGSGGTGAIGAVAKELSSRLSSLREQQRIQVVAYNQAVESLLGRELMPATEDNKSQLVKRLQAISANGQTEHHYGLLAALRLKPEAIFLLTDGGEPSLTPGQLQLLRKLAAGQTSIHCVRFGRGKETVTDHFMTRLAAENGGSYVYCDLNAR